MRRRFELAPGALEFTAAAALSLAVYLAIALAGFTVLAAAYQSETGDTAVPFTYTMLAAVVSVYTAVTTATTVFGTLINSDIRRMERQEANHA